MIGLGLALAAVTVGIVSASKYVRIEVDYLNLDVAEQELKNNKIQNGTIKEIVLVNRAPHIKLDAIDIEGKTRDVEFVAKEFEDTEIKVGMTIKAKDIINDAPTVSFSDFEKTDDYQFNNNGFGEKVKVDVISFE